MYLLHIYYYYYKCIDFFKQRKNDLLIDKINVN